MLRRDVTPERLFFLLVLVGALLLISGLMLRHEGALSSRTFRDGFTVAEGVRRTETVAAAAAARNATEAPAEDKEEAKDVRMTTIKTEDGDEITIKRAGTSKGKITTISRHENGKLTIEDAMEEETETGVESEGQIQDEEAGTYSPKEMLGQKDSAGGQKEAAEAEGEGEGKQAVIVSGGKKVTVEKVNDSLTKVSLSDVEEADEDEGGTR